MFEFAKTLLAAVLLLGAVEQTAEAATIPFQIDSANSTFGLTNCQDFCPALVTLAPAMQGNPTINVTRNGPAEIFDFLRFFPVIDIGAPDTFDITATLAFLAPTVTSFTGSGEGSNFTTTFGIFNILGRFTSGTIVWDAIAPQQVAGVGLVTVAFLNSPPSVFGTGDAINPRSVLTQASISVVPLPAGVLLLGTALLGLFGLSRRRKPALA